MEDTVIKNTAHVRIQDGRACLCLAGEVDVASIDHCRAPAAELLSSNLRQIAVDLTQVTFMDSSGLGLLAELVRHGQDVGAPVLVIDAQPIVRDAITTCGLDQYLELVAADDSRVCAAPGDPFDQ
jgi:anti-sigma B factor antagonist